MDNVFPDLSLQAMDNPEETFKLLDEGANRELFKISPSQALEATKTFPRCTVVLLEMVVGFIAVTDDHRLLACFKPEVHSSHIIPEAVNTYIMRYAHIPSAKQYVIWEASLTPFKTARHITSLPSVMREDKIEVHRNVTIGPVRVVGEMFEPRGVIVKPLQVPPVLLVKSYDKDTSEVGLQDACVPAGYMYKVKLRDEDGLYLHDAKIVERIERFHPMHDKLTVSLTDDETTITHLFED